MSSGHGHGHGHGHGASGSDRSLVIALLLNLFLTVGQLIGGIVSGSLALIADALHNFSDATSLGIAIFARKIARKGPDDRKTFGYRRAEVVAALINLTLLIAICIYLIYEAIWRMIEPQAVAGWIIVILAGVGLVVDSITAIITYRLSKNNLNMQTAFLHNISDAAASLGVILAGTLIILYEWYWVDTLATFAVAGLILWQAAKLFPPTIHFLMDGTPDGLSPKTIKRSLEEFQGVAGVQHIHIWNLDEDRVALQARVIVTEDELKRVKALKDQLKKHLQEKYDIPHSSLEFEYHQ